MSEALRDGDNLAVLTGGGITFKLLSFNRVIGNYVISNAHEIIVCDRERRAAVSNGSRRKLSRYHYVDAK